MGCNGPVETITETSYYAYYIDGKWEKGPLYGTSIFRFDLEGNKISDKWVNEHGVLRKTITSEYNDGVLIKEFCSAVDDMMDYDQILEETQEDGTLVYLVKYNENSGNDYAKVSIKKDGNTKIVVYDMSTKGDFRRSETIIDEFGRSLEEKEFSGRDAKEPWRHVRNEYEEGRCIRTTVLNNSRGNSEVTYSDFDEYGNWKKKSEVNDNSYQHFLVLREYTYSTK